MSRASVSATSNRRGGTLRALLVGVALGAAGVAVAADERPDFTGVWGTYRAPGGQGRGGRPQAPADLPLKPEAKAKVEEFRALVDPLGETPGGWCLGSGMPGSMLGSGGYPMEIVQHDDIVLIVYEAHSEIRRVYLEDRADEEDLFPDRNGYSVGRWEGDKLIVETTHLKEALDQRQFPHSDQARIVEEYTMEVRDDGGKVLTAKMTMTDPVFYTEPVHAEKKWSYIPGGRLLPYECNEPAWEARIEELREQARAGSH